MKLFLIKFRQLFLSFVLILFLSSCASLGFKEDKNVPKVSTNDIKKNKCPIVKIPSKTASYISTKKYILSIKKIKMVCKSKKINKSNLLDFYVRYNAKMELKINKKIRAKGLMLPSIYIAIVDVDNETVLAKMKSDIEISNKEENLIINSNKFRFKYESYENLYVYFGLQ